MGKSSEDSSSSDEENSRLLEALDPNMFGGKTNVTKIKESKEIQDKHCQNYNNNIIRVTPEFQSFVAKHLTEMLDRTIKEYNTKEYDIDYKRSGGIKLFKNSKKLLTDKRFKDDKDNDNAEIINKRNKKRRFAEHEDENYSELYEKAKSVAVSPEWVMEKQGIEGWCKPKGKEIKVKKNESGKLEIISPPFVSAANS